MIFIVSNLPFSYLDFSQGTFEELNLDRSLFIGGFKALNDVPKDSGVTAGFDGAIQRVSNLLKRK